MPIKYLQHSAQLIRATPGEPCAVIANAARVCTQKEGKALVDDREFVRKLMSWGHWSPFEFFDLTFQCVTSRAVTHELVRHRLASYAQESQRYCSYMDDLQVIVPCMSEIPAQLLHICLVNTEKVYHMLLNRGVPSEDARSVLPNCTATRIMVKMNLREFRHFLDLRTGKAAWGEMQKLARAMADAFLAEFPEDAFLIGDVCHA